jgi:hypothetical protein
MRQGQEFSPAERDALIEEARTVPSVLKLAGNFTKAVVKHIGNGMKNVPLTIYQGRLDICNECLPPDGFRVKNRCTHESCGCFIDKKAWWDSEACPLGKWEN